MNKLQTFLNELAEGVIEQAEQLENKAGDDTPQSLALRDYFSQLVHAAEAVDDNERVNWDSIRTKIGFDLVTGF